MKQTADDLSIGHRFLFPLVAVRAAATHKVAQVPRKPNRGRRACQTNRAAGHIATNNCRQ